MYNPSYLIRSRHAIFYFRYPLARYDNQRVSISLQTRCPKEALHLAKALEYHAYMVTSDPDTHDLEYADVKGVLRKHFDDVLRRMKRNIDKDGCLSESKVQNFQRIQSDLQDAIRYNRDEIHGDILSDEDLGTLSIDVALKTIAEKNKIPFEIGGRERGFMREQYKHALLAYVQALLEYNSGDGYYDFADKSTKVLNSASRVNSSELKLSNVIKGYLAELKPNSAREKVDSIKYLVEALGDQCCITEIDYSKARKVKEMLMKTPLNRNKLPETKALSLEQQIKVGVDLQFKSMSLSTVNKYLSCISALFRWAKQNKYIADNPFQGMKVDVDKKEVTRTNFTDEQMRLILASLSSMSIDDATNKMAIGLHFSTFTLGQD